MAAAFPVGVFMLVMAAGITGLWTMDIARSPEIDRSRGLIRAHDGNGSVMLPHWIAEYGTAALLAIGGLGLLLKWPFSGWAWVVCLALGALAYTSLNSLGWVLSDRSRLPYGIPMVIGLVGAAVSVVLILAGSVFPSIG